MTTIHELFESYRAKVMPKDCPPNQYTETRRAFYAAAYAILCEVERIGNDVPDDDAGLTAGASRIQRLFDEGDRFKRAIAEGNA